MTKLPLYDLNGKQAGSVEGSDAIFGADVKMPVIHTAINWLLAGSRQGTASAKTRAEVRGGGKKPWKQKGTGRARAGTIRSPLWRGGGVMFGPKPRDYSYNLPKKVRVLALRMAISDKVKSGKVKVIDNIELKEAKTKEMQAALNAMEISNALVVMDRAGIKEKRACANIKKIKLSSSKNITPFDILKYEWLVIDKDAVSALEERAK